MFNRTVAAIATVVLCVIVSGAAHASSFDPQAATDAYLATISGAARERSDAYFEGGYWIILYNALATIAAALVLLFTRASAAMRDFAESMTSWRWLQTFIYGVLFVFLMSVMTFPLAMYTEFTREHAFGLSNMSMNEWLKESAISLGVGCLMTGIFLVGLYGVIRRTGESWWIWGSAVAVIFVSFGALIGPVFIAPLFNEYKPMREGELKEQILSLARANGVPAQNVYEFDASKQSKRISANVSGAFGTTRVSLNDNLLNRSTPQEVRAVMAHEIGHYALGHIYEMLISVTLIAAIGFLLTDIGFGMLHGLFGEIWRVQDFSDTAGLPILVIVSTILGVLATPVTNTMVRTNEAEADIFGLNAAREPDGFAKATLKLSEYRKLDPTPWEEFVFYDHPSGRSRISMAMRWKAEHLSDLPTVTSSAAVPVMAQMAAPASSESPGAQMPDFADPPPISASDMGKAQQ
jgi:STE24 endopeptidase